MIFFRWCAAAAAAVLVVLTAGCADDPSVPRSVTARGTVLSAEPVARMDPGQVRDYLGSQGLDASRVRVGLDASRVVYATVNPTGRPTTASALVVLPRTEQRTHRLVSWQHGTTVFRGETASMNEQSWDRATAFAFASAGYAVSAPDYLGLGVGPGPHPYRDPDSEVTASVDALRATKTLAERDGRELDDRVLVSGHSQGGVAAMALGRSLQQRADEPSLGLAAIAPMHAPHDTGGMLPFALSGEMHIASGYAAYFVVAWNRLHHLYDSPAEAFRAPHDRTVEGLFDSDHTGEQILAQLPGTPAELFTPEFLQRLRQPSGTLASALRRVDSWCDWRPDAPVQLYTATGDQDVPIANARYCERAIRAAGGDTGVLDLGNVDHSTAATLAVPRVLAWFDELDK